MTTDLQQRRPDPGAHARVPETALIPRPDAARVVAILEDLVVDPVDPGHRRGWLRRVGSLLGVAAHAVCNGRTDPVVARRLTELQGRARRLTEEPSGPGDELAQVEWLRGDLITCVHALSRRVSSSDVGPARTGFFPSGRGDSPGAEVRRQADRGRRGPAPGTGG